MKDNLQDKGIAAMEASLKKNGFIQTSYGSKGNAAAFSQWIKRTSNDDYFRLTLSQHGLVLVDATANSLPLFKSNSGRGFDTNHLDNFLKRYRDWVRTLSESIDEASINKKYVVYKNGRTEVFDTEDGAKRVADGGMRSLVSGGDMYEYEYWIDNKDSIMKESLEVVPASPCTPEMPEAPLNLNMAATFWWKLTHRLNDEGNWDYTDVTYVLMMNLLKQYIGKGAVSFGTPNGHDKYALTFKDNSELHLVNYDGNIRYDQEIKVSDKYDPDLIANLATIIDVPENMTFTSESFSIGEARNPRDYQKVVKSLQHFREKLYSGNHPKAEKDFEKIIKNLEAQLVLLKQQRGIKESVLYKDLSSYAKTKLKHAMGSAVRHSASTAKNFGGRVLKELTLTILNELAKKLRPQELDYEVRDEIDKLRDPEDKAAILVMFVRDMLLGRAQEAGYDTSNFDKLTKRSGVLDDTAERLFPDDMEESTSIDEAKVLTIAQRLKRKAAFKRIKGKIKIGREKAERRHANDEVLRHRAKNKAKTIIFKKLTKGKGKDELSFSQRAQIEKLMLKRTKGIDRLAQKLLAQVRKQDIDKFRTHKEK